MELDVLATAEAAAQAAAARIAREARRAVRERGRFVVALSGGRTPWQMMELLGAEELPWEDVRVVQVDERIAPAGHPARNLTHLRESLIAKTPLRESQLLPMPVDAENLDTAATDYAKTLEGLSGSPPRLDLVQLGLGADGHTASLVADDAVLEVDDRDVALTDRAYQGHRRMTLTFPVLARARRILWLATGAEKAPMVERLLRADPTIPAGRVPQSAAVLVADREATAALARH
jgi:6-phosphogluconolactonase